jgi:hypothetical protein
LSPFLAGEVPVPAFDPKFDTDPDERLPVIIDVALLADVDPDTHRCCFDYALAVVAARGDVSRIPDVPLTLQ